MKEISIELLIQLLDEIKFLLDSLLETNLKVNDVHARTDKIDNYVDVEVNAAKINRDQKIKKAQENFDASLQLIEKQFSSDLKKFEIDETRSVDQVISSIDPLLDSLGYAGLPWESNLWKTFNPDINTQIPHLIRIGKLYLEKYTELSKYQIPALIPIASEKNIIIHFSSSITSLLNAVIQNLIIRMLAVFPPGLLELYLVDPRNNGDCFRELSATGYDWSGKRIYCQDEEIQEILSQINKQVYEVGNNRLSQFSSIDEYNRQGFGQKIPYRYLVIMNFPYGFNATSASLLEKIVLNGPKTGIYTILHINKNREIPKQWDWNDSIIRDNCFNLWHRVNNQFESNDASLRNIPVYVDSPPQRSIIQNILAAFDKSTKNQEVEHLNFDSLQINMQHQGKGTAIENINVPIGVDTNGNPFSLVLGSQKVNIHHGFIGGATGSGKGNMLRVLITQLLLKYPANELQLYLIDFKKGVDFNNYKLSPQDQIQAVALESIREFGIAVLEKLVLEAESRNKKFKEYHVENYEEFRINSKEPLPRILLVIDEFWKFFEPVDRLANNAASLLKQLALSGRSVGISILLVSQRVLHDVGVSGLSDIYAQLKLRISFQVNNPIDSERILGPGHFEANQLKQYGYAIVLNSSEGITSTVRIAKLMAKEQLPILDHLKSKQYKTFERSSTRIFDNEQVGRLIENPYLFHPEAIDSFNPVLWIGEPIAVKEDTNVILDSDSLSNLLIIGNKENVAQGIISNIVTGLHVAYKAKIRVCIISPTRRSSQISEYYLKFKMDLGKDVEVIGNDNFETWLDAILLDINNRDPDHDISEYTRTVVFVAGLNRIKSLYDKDDKGRPVSSAPKKMLELCDNGPLVGIHSVIWANDTELLRPIFSRDFHRYFRFFVGLKGIDKQDSMDLFDSSIGESLLDGYGLFRDKEWHQDKTELFRPYQEINLNNLAKDLDQIQKK